MHDVRTKKSTPASVVIHLVSGNTCGVLSSLPAHADFHTSVSGQGEKFNDGHPWSHGGNLNKNHMGSTEGHNCHNTICSNNVNPDTE